MDIQSYFPILKRPIKGKRLVYLDNAGTTLTPTVVTDKVLSYYHEENANIHRGVHTLSQLATDSYEAVREKVRSFINAKQVEEIIFTSGVTDSVNLVAYSYGINFLKSGDEIIVSHMEHHSNLVPWHLISKHTGAVVKAINLNSQGELDLQHYRTLLTDKTKLVSVTSGSNTLGTINPVKEIIAEAHRVGALVFIDAAQSIAHYPIDVQDWDADFLGFSAHKMFGPTGVGVLYGKRVILDKMPPYKGGGSMISEVKVDASKYLGAPQKFEAGTPPIAQVIGMGRAIDFINEIGFERIESEEKTILQYATEKLEQLPYLKIIGTAKNKLATISFVMNEVHPHDVGTMLDDEGVAVRTGHHCTEPIMKHFKVPATARASMSIYNTKEDIDALVTALEKTQKLFTV